MPSSVQVVPPSAEPRHAERPEAPWRASATLASLAAMSGVGLREVDDRLRRAFGARRRTCRAASITVASVRLVTGSNGTRFVCLYPASVLAGSGLQHGLIDCVLAVGLGGERGAARMSPSGSVLQAGRGGQGRACSWSACRSCRSRGCRRPRFPRSPTASRRSPSASTARARRGPASPTRPPAAPPAMRRRAARGRTAAICRALIAELQCLGTITSR